ncbi:hypothetical protein QDR37_05535 [Amnibacterium sp. CER49]|uniref:hypothetical protein n=1 Tax=Amnibacterium sp. CER49 TaxID=3039161 RepID=UPI00244D546A|nr:hypothetical protein [Amnibacterium sp. CER49]MDH2443402.1 hypothetical protein [Amnibacterium sp. CER49]
MASRSLRVAFRSDETLPRHSATADDLQVHDIDVAPGTEDVPQLLENPHVDFPGRWVLAGEADGMPVYVRDRALADTNDTVAL